MAGQLDYKLYSEHFADDIAKILQENLRKDQVDSAQALARECAQNEADAVDKVNKILAGIGRNMNRVLDDAKGRKAKELVQEYVRREPDAVNLVNELLTDAGQSMDAFEATAFANRLDSIERSGLITWRPSPRAAATPACTRSSGGMRCLAQRCDGACKKSRTASSR